MKDNCLQIFKSLGKMAQKFRSQCYCKYLNRTEPDLQVFWKLKCLSSSGAILQPQSSISSLRFENMLVEGTAVDQVLKTYKSVRKEIEATATAPWWLLGDHILLEFKPHFWIFRLILNSFKMPIIDLSSLLNSLTFTFPFLPSLHPRNNIDWFYVTFPSSALSLPKHLWMSTPGLWGFHRVCQICSPNIEAPCEPWWARCLCWTLCTLRPIYLYIQLWVLRRKKRKEKEEAAKVKEEQEEEEEAMEDGFDNDEFEAEVAAEWYRFQQGK